MKWKATEKKNCFVNYVHRELKDAEFIQVVRMPYLEPNGNEALGAHAPVVGHHRSRRLIPLPLWRLLRKVTDVGLK